MAEAAARDELFKKVLRRALKAPVLIVQTGPAHCLRLAGIYLVMPAVMSVLPHYARARRKLFALMRGRSASREIAYWRQRKQEIIKAGESGHRTPLDELGWDSETARAIRNDMEKTGEAVIAEVDQDGDLLSHYGHLKNVPLTNENDFYKRKRFQIQLVAFQGFAGIKKDYAGNRLSFLNELEALHDLGQAGCNVPAVLDADFDNLRLTMSYIPGAVLREELARKGAALRDRDAEVNPEFKGLPPGEIRMRQIREGAKRLYDVVGVEFADKVFGQMRKIHERGFMLNDVKYGNIIIERKTGEPYLIDFELCMKLSGLGRLCFQRFRDQDIGEFNLHFGADKPTYAALKKAIAGGAAPFAGNWYAPAHFGYGLRVGPIWNPDSGYGRWHYILKKSLPPLEGKRILDLGCNNGLNSLQFLRCGADEVIGVELNDAYIEQSRLLKSIYEWADNRTYRFQCLKEDMAEAVKRDLGKIDIAVALCSIYYLDDAAIAGVIRRLSETADLFVLQCNTAQNIGREDPHIYVKASLEYTVRALKENGFPVTRVIRPRGYPRPLVIGSKS